MGALVFVCPATGLEVFTGLEMDHDSFAALPSVLPDIRCPHCPKPHQLSEVSAWLAEGERRTDGTASGELPLPSSRSFAETSEKPGHVPAAGFLVQKEPYISAVFDSQGAHSSPFVACPHTLRPT